MKISIITPCLNSKTYISETIESVINQKGDFEIEYIIVDGGSDDGTQDIIKNYCNLLKEGKVHKKCKNLTIKTIIEKDESMYEALAKGFRVASGEIVGYINSDDFYLPGAFQTAVEIFNKFSSVNWILGYRTLYNEGSCVIECLLPFKIIRPLLIKGFYGTYMPFIQQESIFFRRQLLEAISLKELEKFKYAGDYYIWNNFAKAEDLYIVRAGLGGFRIREDQLSKKMRKEYMNEFKSIRDKVKYPKVLIFFLWALFIHLLYYLPDKIKPYLNRSIIYFDIKKQDWVSKKIRA